MDTCTCVVRFVLKAGKLCDVWKVVHIQDNPYLQRFPLLRWIYLASVLNYVEHIYVLKDTQWTVLPATNIKLHSMGQVYVMPQCQYV